MNKQRMRILLTVIVILVIYATLLRTCGRNLTFVTMELINNARMMNDDKLTECLNANQSDFENVRQLFDAHPNIFEISREKISIDNKNIHLYRTKNKMYVASDKELNKNELDEIDKSGAVKILKNLRFLSIENNKGEINFMQATSLSEAKGIIYIPNIDKYNNSYFKLKGVKDSWYIYDYV